MIRRLGEFESELSWNPRLNAPEADSGAVPAPAYFGSPLPASPSASGGWSLFGVAASPVVRGPWGRLIERTSLSGLEGRKWKQRAIHRELRDANTKGLEWGCARQPRATPYCVKMLSADSQLLAISRSSRSDCERLFPDLRTDQRTPWNWASRQVRRFIPDTGTVLDLASGYGNSWIMQHHAARRYSLELLDVCPNRIPCQSEPVTPTAI